MRFIHYNQAPINPNTVELGYNDHGYNELNFQFFLSQMFILVHKASRI